jgi:hypothetical protein
MSGDEDPKSLGEAVSSALDDIASEMSGALNSFPRLDYFFENETSHLPPFAIERIRKAVDDFHTVCESHIEIIALAKMMAYNIAPDGQPPRYPSVLANIADVSHGNVTITPQVGLRPYRADFIIRGVGRPFVVECDGRDFHNSRDDAARDEDIEHRFGLKTFRLTGREIWKSNAWLPFFGHWCRGQMVARNSNALWLLRLFSKL